MWRNEYRSKKNQIDFVISRERMEEKKYDNVPHYTALVLAAASLETARAEEGYVNVAFVQM